MPSINGEIIFCSVLSSNLQVSLIDTLHLGLVVPKSNARIGVRQ